LAAEKRNINSSAWQGEGACNLIRRVWHHGMIHCKLKACYTGLESSLRSWQLFIINIVVNDIMSCHTLE
jgi:hypothetical protein